VAAARAAGERRREWRSVAVLGLNMCERSSALPFIGKRGEG
jgi:hypothetical protein